MCNKPNRSKSLVTVTEVSIKNLKDCHPVLVTKVLALISLLAEKEGLYFAVFQGYRTKEHQTALYSQGREPLAVVNYNRDIALLPPITEKENKKKVTNVKYSWHCAGIAADLVLDKDIEKGGVQWCWQNINAYLKIGAYAKALGLNWGGFWKSFKDYPHVELPCELTLSEASVLPKHAVWKMVEKVFIDKKYSV